jgi:hypothetical protein
MSHRSASSPQSTASAPIDEILQEAGRAADDEQARGFIEKLWQYDQIVFDATA